MDKAISIPFYSCSGKWSVPLLRGPANCPPFGRSADLGGGGRCPNPSGLAAAWFAWCQLWQLLVSGWQMEMSVCCELLHVYVFSFLQRVSIACYAERCISYSKSVRLSVCLSVRHTLALSQNDTSYNHGVFTGGWPHDSSFQHASTLDFTAKFQREHGERGRQMREG